MKKDDGTAVIYYILMMGIIALISLLTAFIVRVKIIELVNEDTQDAVTLSNLASGLIDLDEYGQTGIVHINNFEHSYNVYVDAIKENLNLSSTMLPINSSYILSEVEIQEYAVYNVTGNDITLTRQVNSNGTSTRDTVIYYGKVGILKTPDDVAISHTTIYSKIGFRLRGFMNNSQNVSKDGSVDIVDN